MIKVGVTIRFRKEVLDTEGRTILKTLQKQKQPVKECAFGKYIELHIEKENQKEALNVARQIAKNILSNELIETFELKIID